MKGAAIAAAGPLSAAPASRLRSAARAPYARTALGATLGLLATLPVYRVLARPDTGLAGSATIVMTDGYAALVWTGLVIALIPALLLSRLIRPGALDAALAAVARPLMAARTTTVALVLAGIAGAIAALFGRFVMHGQPALIDAMSQLVQARYFAAGRLAGPASDLGAFWQIQQTLSTPSGWVAQYPPMHALLLAAGMGLGAVWLVGPVMLAVTVLFTTLAAERLLPASRVVARLGALLLALSAFAIAHAGAYMNHTTAAAFGAFALYAALRAAESRPSWAAAMGGALGAMLATRPLSALVTGVVLLFVVAPDARTHPRATLSRLAMVALGALPFVVALGAFNAHFFGSPLRFGYDAALGPAGGLGFGVDPWGNTFGPLQAIAYTAAELQALSLFLLETPFPVVVLIALALATTPTLTGGERVIVALALLPLAANLAYWHHGLFMGPRMLNESAPAWCLLAAWAAVRVVERTPAAYARAAGYSPRVFLTGALLAAALAAVVLAPMRLASYGIERPEALGVAAAAPAGTVVFVHGGWTSRLAMRLAAGGMRLDSVETALRQNGTCTVQRRVDGDVGAKLDFAARATDLPTMIEIAPGDRIRQGRGEAVTRACAREAASDRLGVADITPLLWQAGLPGITSGAPLLVRDLGPRENARLIASLPGREVYAIASRAPDGPLELMPYGEAMALLWGTNP